MRSKHYRSAAAIQVLLAVLFMFSASLSAQTFRGTISGTLSDPAGAVVSGAPVQAINEATSVSYSSVTSSAGQFNFSDLPLGNYTVRVQAPGFQPLVVSAVGVDAGVVHDLALKLSIAQGTQTVEVTAAQLSLDTEASSQTTVLSQITIDSLPLHGGDFLQTQALIPGYAGYANQGNGGIDGTRWTQKNFQIDGTDNNDPWHNMSASNEGGVLAISGALLPTDAVEEFSYQKDASAETGRNPGGTFNSVIKSGTNQLHGSAKYFFRNEALAAESPFVPSDFGSNQEDRSSNWGGTIGGPIFKDRTFFFAAFEKQNFTINPGAKAIEPGVDYQAAAQSLLAVNNLTANPVSTALLAGLWPSDALAAAGTGENYFSKNPETGYSYNTLLKIDHTINQSNKLSLRWFDGEGSQIAPVSPILKPYYAKAPMYVKNGGAILNSAINASLSNQLQLGYSYFKQSFRDFEHSQVLSDYGLITGSQYTGAPTIIIGGFDMIGLVQPSGRASYTGHLGDVLSWTVGHHQFRFGGEYRRVDIDAFYQNNSVGTLGFTGAISGQLPNAPNNSAFAKDPGNVYALADFLLGSTTFASIATGNQERFVKTNDFSGYVQDAWRVQQRLTLNLGLRYDYQGPVYDGQGDLSTFIPSKGGVVFQGKQISSLYPRVWTNFAPRLGFSYQPTGDHGIVIRGGGGVYFDVPSLDAFLKDGQNNGGGSGIAGNPGGSQPVTTVNSPFGATFASGQPFFQSATSSSTDVGLFSVTQHFSTPVNYNYYLQIEKELGGKSILQVGYVGAQARHQITLADINASAPNATGQPIDSTRPYFSQFQNKYAAINEIETNGNSNYNGLQISLRSHNWHGISAQAAYTFAHALDDMTSVALPKDSRNIRSNYGNSDLDVRHTFTTFLSYAVPGSSYGPRWVTHGWELHSLLSFYTGAPFTVVTGSNDTSGTGDLSQLADVVGNPRANVPSGFYFNPNAFAQPANGTFGNQRRNQFRGPGYSDVDLSVIKRVSFTERVTGEFRAELYNIFNRTNLGTPNTTLGSSAGADRSTIGAYNWAPGLGPGEPFNTQLGFRISF